MDEKAIIDELFLELAKRMPADELSQLPVIDKIQKLAKDVQ